MNAILQLTIMNLSFYIQNQKLIQEEKRIYDPINQKIPRCKSRLHSGLLKTRKL